MIFLPEKYQKWSFAKVCSREKEEDHSRKFIPNILFYSRKSFKVVIDIVILFQTVIEKPDGFNLSQNQF